MNSSIEGQMRSFDAAWSDRIDPVAQLCRRLYLRVGLCPCQFIERFKAEQCQQCRDDKAAIEATWSVPLSGFAQVEDA